MKRMVFVLGAVLAAGVAFAGGKTEAATQPAASTLSGTYQFGGSTTVAPIATLAIEAFVAKNPNVKISYEQPGSSAGIKNLLAGVYSLAGSSRELKDEEKTGGAVAVPICLVGLSVVVNGDVRVDNLSIEQLAKIFTGEISNWKDVGGADATIVVVNRDEASGTYGAFLELVVQKYKKDGKYLANAIVAKENGEVAAKVGSTPHAIGYCGMPFVDMVKSAGGKALAVNGVEASVANVVAKKYPISRQLFLVTKGEATGVEKAFIDFVLSRDGQALVSKAEFIPLP